MTDSSGSGEHVALKERVEGAVALPTDSDHAEITAAYAIMGSPAIIVRPTSAVDVAEAVRYAIKRGLTIAVRSGGHSGPVFGTYDGALVIDLGALTGVEVAGDLVRVGGGATWGAVADALQEHRLAITAGDTTTVGVGGLTLGGGIGWLVRGHGLALDNLVEAEVVTASGVIVIATAVEHSDLFWAIRGGGGNFGIVTAFTFRAQQLDGVVAGPIQFGTENLATTLRTWRDVMRNAPEELNATFLAMPEFGEMPASVQVLVCYGGADEDAANAAIAPLLAIDGVLGHAIEPKAYADILDDPQEPEGPIVMVGNNAFADFGDAVVDAIATAHEQIGGVLMIRYLRGAFNRVPADATAFSHRDSEVLLITAAFLPQDAPPEAAQRINDSWAPVAGQSIGTYSNFTLTVDEAATTSMFSPATLDRLRAVKRVYDPSNVFRRNHNIVPA